MLDKTHIWERDHRNIGDGLSLLAAIPTASVRLAFFDPQYRAMMDKQAYGNKSRMVSSTALPAMSGEVIESFILEIQRVLMPSGYLFFWVDKFILVEGISRYMDRCLLQPVDMITWDKARMGMGYRSRRQSEHLVVLQKAPVLAKATWRDHGIPDVWSEGVSRKGHPHAKPVGLLARLIRSCAVKGDVVIDPCAGSFASMTAAEGTGVKYYGCDLLDPSIY